METLRGEGLFAYTRSKSISQIFMPILVGGGEWASRVEGERSWVVRGVVVILFWACEFGISACRSSKLRVRLVVHIEGKSQTVAGKAT